MDATRRQIDRLLNRGANRPPAEPEEQDSERPTAAEIELAEFRRNAGIAAGRTTGASEKQVRIIRRIPVEVPDED